VVQLLNICVAPCAGALPLGHRAKKDGEISKT